MEIKEFFDRCRDAGIGFRKDDGYEHHDAFDVAMEMVLEDTDLVLDFIGDGLLGPEPNDYEVNARERFNDNLKRSYRSHHNVTSTRMKSRPSSVTTFASSLIYGCGEVGEVIFNIVMDRAEKHVETCLEEWFNDAAAYQYEMDECAREDYYDGMREDMRLQMGDD